MFQCFFVRMVTSQSFYALPPYGGEQVSTGRVEQKEHAGVGYSTSSKHCISLNWQR